MISMYKWHQAKILWAKGMSIKKIAMKNSGRIGKNRIGRIGDIVNYLTKNI